MRPAVRREPARPEALQRCSIRPMLCLLTAARPWRSSVGAAGAGRSRVAATVSGRHTRSAPTRSQPSSPRTRDGSPNLFRSGWGACWPRHSRCSGARRRSWPRTSRRRRRSDRWRSCAVTLILPTSACMPAPNGVSCSTSTTSTRRIADRGNGISSGWPRASSSHRARTASQRTSAATSRGRPAASTVAGSGPMPRCEPCRSGMRRSRSSASSSAWSRPGRPWPGTSASTSRSRTPSARTTSPHSASCRPRCMAAAISSATGRRSSSGCPTTTPAARRSRTCIVPTCARSGRIDGSSSRSTGCSTSRSRSSAWAASGPAATW